MPTFSVLVRAPTEIVWAVLVEKVEDPKRHTPGVDTVEVLERDGATILRKITFGKYVVTEWIHTDAEQLRIDSKLEEHPKYRGTMVKRVTPPASPEGFPTLTYSMDWHPTDPDEEPEDLMPMVMKGVEHTQTIAEERARGS